MSLLDIITIPDPVLRTKCDPVERVDDELRQFMDNMLATMYDAPGVGLAAPQVAVPRRVIVMDAAEREQDESGVIAETTAPPKDPIFMVNPEIIEQADNLSAYEEGCLSIPDYFAEIMRPEWVRVRYIDRDGLTQEKKCEGLLAVVVQHEIDHLDGKLFIDYLSKLRRDRVIKKFIKAKKAALNAAL